MIKLRVNSVLFQDLDFAGAVKHIAERGYDGVEVSAVPRGRTDHPRILVHADAGAPRVDGIRDDLRRVPGQSGFPRIQKLSNEELTWYGCA